jgi:hypothetical protein
MPGRNIRLSEDTCAASRSVLTNYVLVQLLFSDYDVDNVPESEDEDDNAPTASTIVFFFIFYNLTDLSDI